MYKIQYLHLFPFNCNTSTHLFWIESISFLRVSNRISFQNYLMQYFKVSLSSNWRLFLHTLLDKIPHNFSIGFKSGDSVGQSKTWIFFCFKPVFRELRSVYGCVVLLKMALLVSRRFINGKTFFSQHIEILSRVLFPFHHSLISLSRHRKGSQNHNRSSAK